MDLTQRKLTKQEWNSIEIPVSAEELEVLRMIVRGYHQPNLRVNKHKSIFSHLKVEASKKMDEYIYMQYLKTRGDFLEKYLKKKNASYVPHKVRPDLTLNSGDRIRMQRFAPEKMGAGGGGAVGAGEETFYEFVLLHHAEEMVRADMSGGNRVAFHHHLYTLHALTQNSVVAVNPILMDLVRSLLDCFLPTMDYALLLEHASELMEKNASLLKYRDMELFDHQKEIFAQMRGAPDRPQLVLYIAPTGTGKTLTPLALSEQYKIIFVCAARHVGLSLARAAISVRKRVAFAFGCVTPDDIRLHYYAAQVYTVNKRTGGIQKVDNSVGNKVEIMICDIQSYLPAMNYMMAFFDAAEIVTYWDEPTISMDYASHEFHDQIASNWRENVIPKVVLSSATLPKEHELKSTTADFLTKFEGGEVCNIVSHDCRKSIQIVNNEGFVVVPHTLTESFSEMQATARHCSEYLTLLRYIDMSEACAFIAFVLQRGFVEGTRIVPERYFPEVTDMTMTRVKMYYVDLLQTLTEPQWRECVDHFRLRRRIVLHENETVDIEGNRIRKSVSVGDDRGSGAGGGSVKSGGGGKPLQRTMSVQAPETSSAASAAAVAAAATRGTSGVYITTKDAYTLTDGPTLYLSDDIRRVAQFCIVQARIPTEVMDRLMTKIEHNNVLNRRLHELDVEAETIRDAIESRAKNAVTVDGKDLGRKKSSKDSKKSARDVDEDTQGGHGAAASASTTQLYRLTEEMNALRAQIQTACLPDALVPNTKKHLEKWAPASAFAENKTNAFSSFVTEETVAQIMALDGVENEWKLLLMLGIGVFMRHANVGYSEIMKQLADEQKLYLIIATSDYIYGTNYQFCHAYIGRDLTFTQEKIIQAMGRVGRRNVQQSYTVRFRDPSQIAKLFSPSAEKPEVENINALFSGSPPLATLTRRCCDVPATAAVHDAAAIAETENAEDTA